MKLSLIGQKVEEKMHIFDPETEMNLVYDVPVQKFETEHEN